MISLSFNDTYCERMRQFEHELTEIEIKTDNTIRKNNYPYTYALR